VTEPADATEPAEEPGATDEPQDPPLATVAQAVVEEQLAALPETLTPVSPVAPTPIPEAVPAIPLDQTAVDPVELLPESPDVEDTQADIAPDSALVASLRPKLPTRRPSETTNDRRDASVETRNPPRRIIQSPLEAYRLNRTDLIGRSGGQQSGGSGFQESRGPGNSDVTNYAGRVLVHLNRVPPVRVSGRGYARVFFEINPDGSLGSVSVIDSRGAPDIEAAARRQIRNAAPFPIPPNGVHRRLSFVYQNF